MQTRNMTNEELLNQFIVYVKRLTDLYSASDAVKYDEVFNEILRRMDQTNSR